MACQVRQGTGKQRPLFPDHQGPDHDEADSGRRWFDPGEVKTVIIGPCNDREGAVKLGNNQSITQDEADALEAIMQTGYEVEFALIKEAAIGNWKKFRGQFGY